MPAFSTSTRLREACRERCSEFSDPPCFEVTGAGLRTKPCGECLRDVGYEPGDEFDQNAAVGLLV